MSALKPTTKFEKLAQTTIMALLVALAAAWALGLKFRDAGWRWTPLLVVFAIGYLVLLTIQLADLNHKRARMTRGYAALILIFDLILSLAWPIVALAHFGESVTQTDQESEHNLTDRDFTILASVASLAFWSLLPLKIVLGDTSLVHTLYVGCYLTGLAVFPAVMVWDYGKAMRWPMLVLLILVSGFIWPLYQLYALAFVLYPKWDERQERKYVQP